MTPQCVCVVIHWSTDMLFMIYVQTHLLTRWNLPTICGGCPFVHSPSSSNHYSSLFCLLFYIPSAVIRPMWHFIDRLWLSLLWSVSINILIGCVETLYFAYKFLLVRMANNNKNFHGSYIVDNFPFQSSSGAQF